MCLVVGKWAVEKSIGGQKLSVKILVIRELLLFWSNVLDQCLRSSSAFSWELEAIEPSMRMIHTLIVFLCKGDHSWRWRLIVAILPPLGLFVL